MHTEQSHDLGEVFGVGVHQFLVYAGNGQVRGDVADHGGHLLAVELLTGPLLNIRIIVSNNLEKLLARYAVLN